MFSTNQIKKDFPIFKNHPRLVYLDSTATALKPQSVIDRINEYYTSYSANVARGLYKISERATQEYENTRQIVAKFINAQSADEVIFTRSTTESINLIAYSLGREIVGKGDEIVISIMEHHSNFVPWQQLAFSVGADFKVIDVTDEGYLQIGESYPYSLDKIITKKTKILALPLVSNVLGTINPIKEIVTAAKKINPKIIIIVDAAQAVPHMKVDVQDLGCDFLAFSSHKMLGPTGVGVLWGKKKLLDSMFPFNYGGEMIDEVTIEKSTFNSVPHKFEAGTPHIDGVIALSAAIEYLQNIGLDKVRHHEMAITGFAIRRLKAEFGGDISIFGPENIKARGGVVAFTLKKCHPHDIAQILDSEDICIRAGHHCAMPLHTRLGIGASSRASFYIYNEAEDVERLVKGLRKAQKILT